MRCHWIPALISVLLSIGLLMVIMGQYQEINLIAKKNEELKMITERAYNDINEHLKAKMLLEDKLTQYQKGIVELEEVVAKSSPDVEKKKTEIDACQTEMKTKKEELDAADQAQKSTMETLNAESDAWKKEIAALNSDLTQKRPICDYVKKDPKVVELCGNKTS